MEGLRQVVAVQSNRLKWIALGRHYENPLRQSIYLSRFYTIHCVYTGPDRWYSFKQAIHPHTTHTHTRAHTHTHTQLFNGLWSGTTRVSQYQKKHLPTHTHPDHRTSFIVFLHLQRSMASSLFSLRAWQSFFDNLSPGPLWSSSWSWTLYFIHHAFHFF